MEGGGGDLSPIEFHVVRIWHSNFWYVWPNLFQPSPDVFSLFILATMGYCTLLFTSLNNPIHFCGICCKGHLYLEKKIAAAGIEWKHQEVPAYICSSLKKLTDFAKCLDIQTGKALPPLSASCAFVLMLAILSMANSKAIVRHYRWRYIFPFKYLNWSA